jgi:hypothetical protein
MQSFSRVMAVPTNMVGSQLNYGAGETILIGSGTTMNTWFTTDGTTWVYRSPPAGDPNSVYAFYPARAYGNGKHVEVGYHGAYQVFDGTTWAYGIVGGGATGPYPNTLAFGNGTFVGISGGFGSITSTDGKTWAIHSGPSALPASYGEGLVFDGTLFRAYRATGSTSVHTSPDGVTWSAGTTSHPILSVAFAEGHFLGVTASTSAAGGQIVLSSDGINWRAVRDLTADEHFTGGYPRLAIGRVLK